MSIWAARLRYGVRCAARSRKSGWIRMQRMRYVFRYNEVKELQDKLQKMTDNYIRDIEKLMDEKSKEIMKV